MLINLVSFLQYNAAYGNTRQASFLNRENRTNLEMGGQTVEIFQLKNTNDFKPTETIGVDDKKIDRNSAETSHRQNSITMMEPGFEFFTRFTYCQALLFKSWVEASDQVAKKLPDVKRDSKNSKEISTLHIKIYEETFTNLFKSPEYASNLGKMINASMSLIRNYKVVSEKNNVDFDKKDPLNKNKL